MPAHRLLVSCLIALTVVFGAGPWVAAQPQPFHVIGPNWELLAGAGEMPSPGRPGRAWQYVQLELPKGALDGTEATFDQAEGWVELQNGEGRWQDVTVRGKRVRLSGAVLDVEDGWLSPCHTLGTPEYSLHAERFQLVDYRGYIFLHASNVDLAVFGQKLVRVPRVDLLLDTLVDRFRSYSALADQGWFVPGVGLDQGLTLSGHYRFLNRPGAKGYLQSRYSTVRQFSAEAVAELNDGAENLLLGVVGFQQPAPVPRSGPWGYLRGVHRFSRLERIETTVSAREALSGQTVSRIPEVAFTTDWRRLGVIDLRYDLRLGQFIVENGDPLTRFGGQLELGSVPVPLWPGGELRPMVEAVGRTYLQQGPLYGAAAQLQLMQSLGDVQLMARARQRWAHGDNPLRYENYISDQVLGGMVSWQIVPELRVGLFGEWSVARSAPVALDVMGSYVSDCLALHLYYNALYGSAAFRWNLLAF